MANATQLKTLRRNVEAATAKDGYVMTSSVMMSPAMAKRFIELGGKNRHAYEKTVSRYAAAMKADEWERNGETVKIGSDGSLLDGQHRLLACIDSGKTIPLLIVWDIAPQAFKTIDTGRMRGAADILAIHGESNTAILGATLKLLWCYRNDDLERFSRMYRITHVEMMDLLEREPGIRYACSATHGGKFHGVSRILPPSVAAFCFYVFSCIDAEVAEAFYTKLNEAIGLKRRDAVRHLRDKLIDNRTKARGLKLSHIEIMALTFRAWNHSIARKPCDKLAFRWAGKNPEPFPTIETKTMQKKTPAKSRMPKAPPPPPAARDGNGKTAAAGAALH